LCRVYLPHSEEADEAAQEVFLRAYKKLQQFQKESLFSTWLHRIAVNYCLDVRRRLKRRDETSLDELFENAGELNLSPQPSFEDRLETGELARNLLSRLTATDRDVLVLREISGQTYEEIAESLRISVDAVKSRLKRARQALIESARHLFKSENV
jgi:RNA polymerase sigma-70 factor (ECF subfamily)